jgi:flagellar motility protein MotE (MotC chaperone)
MRFFLLLLLMTALSSEERSYTCNKIFEERKAELILELDKIDEQQQVLEALRHATEKVLEAKEEKLLQNEQEIEVKLKQIQADKEEIARIFSKNQTLLEEIKKAKDDKIIDTYTKMKPGAAAEAMGAMDGASAAAIIFNLTPKQAAKIFDKMEPQKAAELTELLQKGPPFTSTR